MTTTPRVHPPLDSHAAQGARPPAPLAPPDGAPGRMARRPRPPSPTTLGTNTGATSYHLRKLASVGLVEETERGPRARALVAGGHRDARLDRARRRRRPGRRGRHATGCAATTCARSSSATRRGSTRTPSGRSNGRTSPAPATTRSASPRPGWPRSRTNSRRCSSATAREPPADDPDERGGPGLPPRLPARGRPSMTALDARSARRRYPRPGRPALAADRAAHPGHRPAGAVARPVADRDRPRLQHPGPGRARPRAADRRARPTRSAAGRS